MARVVVFGIGSFAEVVHFYLTYDSPHEVVAFTVDRKYLKNNTFHDLPVLPFEEIEKSYSRRDFKMFVPLASPGVRAERYAQAKEKGYELITYVSSKAMTCPNLVVGDNCLIADNTVIHPYATIGNNVIVLSGSLVSHHTTIKDHCFLAPHVVVAGNTIVEPYCFLGLNATVRDNITIARQCVIGAGALVMMNTVEGGVYLGRDAELYPKRSTELPEFLFRPPR